MSRDNGKRLVSSKMKLFFRMVSMLLVAVMIVPGLALNKPVEVKAASIDYSAVFDATYYSNHYSDMKRFYGDDANALLKHFITYGMKEGRQGNEEFNVFAYKLNYKDLRDAFGDDLVQYYMHYINTGKAEGRIAIYEKQKKTEPAKEQSFYDNSVFIGESIMADLHSYAQLTDSSVITNSKFLAMDSFSLAHAIKDYEDDKTQPSYEGVKRNVWESVKLMKADRVFLCFGANDLKKNGVSKTLEDYKKLIAKIREANPAVKIYVISMMPVKEGKTKGFLNKNTIKELNRLLLEDSTKNGYIYINMYESLIDKNDNLVEDYCSDNYINENQKAFKEKWEKVFTRFAKEQMAQGN